MELKQIFTIKNHPGLYRAVKGINGGFVAESLTDGRKERITDGSEDAFCLAEITLYGQKKDIPLAETFKRMHAHTEEPVHVKADVVIVKDYFRAILPELDEKRVFANDLRKVISWYNMLNGKVDFSNIITEERNREAA